MRIRSQWLAILALASSLACGPTVLAADAAKSSAFIGAPGEAESLARQNGCFKCHAINKQKEGPSYHDVAVKYKDNPGAEARLITHITSGEKAKFPDGHEEEHKIIKTKDPKEIKMLVNWILSL